MEAIAALRDLIAQDRLSHAWLLLGGTAEMRRKAAEDVAAALMCDAEKERPCEVCPQCRKLRKGIHPDLITLLRNPEKREITVDQVRTLRQEAWVLPNEAKRKVFLIPEADTLNVSAQNALLKVLEEPPATAAFLLLGENPGAFLPTVRSRCVTLNLAPGAEELSDSPVAAALCEAWLKGDALAFVTAAFPCEKYEREKFDTLLEDMVLAAALRARAARGEGRRRALLLTEKLDKLKEMRKVYVSPGHCLGWLLSTMEN